MTISSVKGNSISLGMTSGISSKLSFVKRLLKELLKTSAFSLSPLVIGPSDLFKLGSVE